MQNSLKILLLCLTLISLWGCRDELVTVRMESVGDDFYSLPWPNDTRRKSDGSLDLDGYPALEWNFVLKSILARGAKNTFGFGLNAGVLWQLSGEIDESSLPTPLDSLADDSPIQLVNIDPQSPHYLQRTPVRVQFSKLATFYKPDNLLTVMPYPGYSLAPGARYAALIFDGVRDNKFRPLVQNNLLKQLQSQAQLPTTSILTQQGAAFRQQYAWVSDYLALQSTWRMQNLVGFTVFTTQRPTEKAGALARAVKFIPDQQILERVHSLSVSRACPGYAVLTGELDIPRWQAGQSPYLTSGGNVTLDSNGNVIMQDWERTPFTAVIGCATPSPEGRSVIVRAGGTGADASSARAVPTRFFTLEQFSSIVVSIAPLHSSERRSERIDQFSDFLAQLGLDFSETELEGFAYYNYINPVAGVGNQLQGAADHMYLRRFGEQMPALLQRFGIPMQQLGLSQDALVINAGHAGLISQSQGAGNTPLALAMDENFKFAYLNGAASHAYPQALHRGSVRKLLNSLLVGVVASELDDFHPLMQFLQTFHEPADGANYAGDTQVKDLLITAGYYDGCVVREGAGALGLAYAKANKLHLGFTGTGLPGFSGIDTMLGQEATQFPVTEPNLNHGGVGLFLEIVAGHDGAGAEETIRAFLDNAAQGANRAIPMPVIPTQYWACDSRYE